VESLSLKVRRLTASVFRFTRCIFSITPGLGRAFHFDFGFLRRFLSEFVLTLFFSFFFS